MNAAEISSAQQLLDRLPLLSQHKDQVFLVKYGGAAMERPEVRHAVCKEIALLSILGIRIVVVHGGGKEISRLLERLSIPSQFIQGLRVTSTEAMTAIEMALSGSINKDLTSRITRSGAPAIGLSGRDAHILQGSIIKGTAGEDLGLAGEVVRCNTKPIDTLLEAKLIPVVSPVAETVEGTPLNINADYAAAALAGALVASGCIFLTDVDGVKHAGSIQETLSPDQIKDMIEGGSITGGMIPKVQCAIQALTSGCRQATICNAATPGIVSQAITRTPGAGTTVTSMP
jgi:acetylglutamate kinase